MQAATLRSIPTSAHYDLRGKCHDWIERSWLNFPSQSVCVETIFGHLEISYDLRGDTQCNTRGQWFCLHVFLPQIHAKLIIHMVRPEHLTSKVPSLSLLSLVKTFKLKTSKFRTVFFLINIYGKFKILILKENLRIEMNIVFCGYRVMFMVLVMVTHA